MRLSPRRLAVVLAAVVLSASTSAFAQDNAPPPPPGPPPPPPANAPPPPSAPPSEAAPTERTANNALYIELLGPGLLYSLDYDRTFGPVAARVGIEYWSLSASGGSGSSSATFLSFPVTVSYLGIGSLKHIFEIGAGAEITYFGGSASVLGASSSGSAVTAWGTILAGYRYQPPDGGFFLRAGISPLIGSGFFLPWPYVGLGATF
jgi:hypothetical protein